jgi:hypothetical protein
MGTDSKKHVMPTPPCGHRSETHMIQGDCEVLRTVGLALTEDDIHWMFTASGWKLRACWPESDHAMRCIWYREPVEVQDAE